MLPVARLILALVVVVPLSASATPVDEETAARAARAFAASVSGRASKPAALSPITLRPLLDVDGSPLGYVAALAPEGFLALSADTRIEPLIASSSVGSCPAASTPDDPLLRLLRADLRARLHAAAQGGETAQEYARRNADAWERLLCGAAAPRRAGALVYGPLLATSWDQGPPWNAYCPVDPVSGERSLAGCVATAVAQVCAYWKHPTRLTFTDGDAYLTLTHRLRIPDDASAADFPTFGQMNAALEHISHAGDSTEAAWLTFAAGVAFRTDYTSAASAAGMHNTDYWERLAYSSRWMPWDAAAADSIAACIRDGIPVPLSTFRNGSGHSAVIDGYDEATGQFHVNMGWGGRGDLWYTLPAVDEWVVAGTVQRARPGATITWAREGSPYRITETVTVMQCDTLVVEAGVDVLFDANVPLVVLGSLDVRGTEADSVRFLRARSHSWGGIVLSGGRRSSFAYARVSGADSEHGGVSCTGSGTRLVMRHCVLSGNNADYDGGGLFSSATAELSDCTLRCNTTVDHYGGGMHSAGTATLTRCLLVDNVALWGSGFFSFGAATLVNCTISRNAALYGGGLFCAFSGAVTVTNCIIHGNDPLDVYGGPGVISATYSCVPEGYPGTGNVVGDPLFVDAAAGDYRLQATSPCVDTGDPSSPTDTDGTRADMGALPLGGTVGVTGERPLALALEQNAPNPFNPTTTISFALPAGGTVSLVVYDITGTPVRTLVSGVLPAGRHSALWDGLDDAGRDAASGVYLCRLRTRTGTLVRRMTLVR